MSSNDDPVDDDFDLSRQQQQQQQQQQQHAHDLNFNARPLQPQPGFDFKLDSSVPFPEHQEDGDSLVFEAQEKLEERKSRLLEAEVKMLNLGDERNSLMFDADGKNLSLGEDRNSPMFEAEGKNLNLGEERNSLMFEAEEKKLSLGEFRTMALTDIDGSLRLPGEELEQLGKRVPVRVEEPDNVVVERGRLRIHNVGGSLTFLLQIALLAWGVRQLRSVLAKRRQKQAPRINTVPFRPSDPPLFITLSALAVKKLVETYPISHILIDVRFPEAVQANPFPLKNTINIPEAEVRICFQLSEAEWASRFPCVRTPNRSQLLVFLSTKGRRAQRAAIAAAELGYNGCCVLSGGIQAFHVVSRTGEQFQPPFLSRDAVAILLQEAEQNQARNMPSSKPLHLVDVRRHDERALYGHIHGSLHIPVSEWPKALVMEASDWERNYHCPKFGKDDLVILYCRTNNGSSWAAQVAYDAGMNRCFVCRGGVLGWRLDATVLPYDGYALGDPPPDPHKFEVETVNCEAAEQELQQLGLL